MHQLVLNRLRTAVGVGLLAISGFTVAQTAGTISGAFAHDLVPFSSEEGMGRLARSTANVDFPALANQFEAQSNAMFCGPTSATIVLNALRVPNANLPRDKSRLQPEDLKHIPVGVDPSIARFTQETVIAQGEKTRAQILGEPVQSQDRKASDFGYQLWQLNQMLQANGAKTQMVIVDNDLDEKAVKDALIENLQRRNDYVIIAYKRDAVGQRGGGHISPLGAYDATSDSFLVMDVNPSAAGWVWMPSDTLIRGMRTFDTITNRGFIAVK